MTPEPFVSARVVAEHLDIGRRQVLAMTRAGKLPAHAVDPAATRKQWRYKLSQVDAAIGENPKPSADFGLGQSATQTDNKARQPRHQKGK
ncbi:MAG: helix-turn-helix domain-containing protein [Candidatus Sulfotelmatobacter sp.]|jgi:hypothetical protein